MKYIKEFNNFDIKQVKKFIVSLDANNYFIDQMVGVSGDTLLLKNYCIYDANKKDFEKNIRKMTIQINIRFLKHVIYSASNYEDCYNYLKIIIDADKYNI